MLEYITEILLIAILYELQTFKKLYRKNAGIVERQDHPVYYGETKLAKLLASISQWKKDRAKD
jgi:hypothetical protein